MSFLLRRPLLSPITHTSSLKPTSTPLLRAFSTSPSRPIAKMTIVGRLGAEAELVPTASGNDMIRYALATSHGPKDNRQTSWWKVACFAPEGGLRELVMGLGKGSMIYVEGDASMRKFQRDGEREQNALSIVQHRIEIVDKRPHSSEEAAMFGADEHGSRDEGPDSRDEGPGSRDQEEARETARGA